MNIYFYEQRIKKYKKMLKSGKSKYSSRRLQNWIDGCNKKIKEIKLKRKKK